MRFQACSEGFFFSRNRGRFQAAHQTFSSLPAHYKSHKHKAPAIESYLLYQTLEMHREAEMAKNKEWVDTVLSFLGCEKILELDPGYFETLLEELKGVVADSEEGEKDSFWGE